MTPLKIPLSKAQIASFIEKIPWSQRLWILSAVVGLATLGSGFFGIQAPFRQSHQALFLRLQEERSRLELLVTIRSQEKKLQTTESSVLLPGGTSALTSELFRLASEGNLKIESVTPQPEAAFGPYQRIQIKVVGKSRFFDLVRFLHLLERHEPLLKVDRLTVGSVRKGSLAETESESSEAWVGMDQHDVGVWISAFSHP